MRAPKSVEQDLGWALFTVVRRYRRLTDGLLNDLPGGPRGYQVLLAAQAGGPRSQLALAQYLGLDRTVMTYLLDELERAGLVRRAPDPADRRVRRVELSDQGAATLADARGRLRGIEDELLEPLPVPDRHTLRGLLHRLATGDLGDAGQL
ncbi:MarR family transcriptional regulator [Tsukamurella sp. 8F]|uniref:MarR family winged helix-turn-helix transcriptional regulator n=1 Tax=unclassified Tsukamurella TaxID=2633480 RepID=UPI0023B8D0FB|nr:MULTISPECIES: MarR family transcriptional regulator [unclassified Tsukamurella]MDF0530583.1 MarR family transcriptional regulator [Tsukamurella sp. 8J]MDF0586767.1 MarR family transcriptional regulator [Tsukamurella sp. 8F]